MDITLLLKAVGDYGLAIVVAVLALIALVYLFRLYSKSWDDRLTFVDARRQEERTGRLEAESRLASNSVALREATTAFMTSQRIMEDFMERERDVRSTRRS